MKIVHILTLYAILVSKGFAQDCTPIRPLYAPCSTTENPVGGLSLQPNKVWFVFETCWFDQGPKTISATLNGQVNHSVFKTVDNPGIDSISIEYFPPIPGGVYNAVNVTFAIFNPGESFAYYESSNEPMTGRAYLPPLYFEIADVQNISGQEVTVAVNADDWNITPSIFYDCGHKKTEVEVRLINCEDNSVVASQRQPQSTQTEDQHVFVFEYDGQLVYVRAEARLVHTEDSLSEPFGNSLSGLVATDQTECFVIGEINTGQTEKPVYNKQIQNATVNIMDMSGRLLMVHKVASENLVLPNDLPQGTYLIQIGNNMPRLTVKCSE